MLVEDRSLQGSPGWGGPFVWQALLCFFAVLHLKAILCKILLPAAVHCSRLKTAVFLLTIALDLKEADLLLGFAIINRSSFSFCFCCAAFKVIPVNSCLFAQHWFLARFCHSYSKEVFLLLCCSQHLKEIWTKKIPDEAPPVSSPRGDSGATRDENGRKTS